MVALENRVQKILSLCEKHWVKYQKDCSGFVKAVASEIGITITGQANDIVDQLSGLGWSRCKNGIDARQKALEGNFVLGGLKSAPHGHVVIVVRGPLAHGNIRLHIGEAWVGLGKRMPP
jgi:hypothetical protein